MLKSMALRIISRSITVTSATTSVSGCAVRVAVTRVSDREATVTSAEVWAWQSGVAQLAREHARALREYAEFYGDDLKAEFPTGSQCKKGLTEIAVEVRELAGRAREKKLKPEEYTGSTFSISNLGMFGIEEFTAVINPPEAAILAVGAVGPKVVVDDEGNMAIRQRMRVTLSCDHRVIDGATGAQFLQTFKQYLEDPMMMIA